MKLVHKLTGLLLLSASAVLVGYGYLTVDREEAMLLESMTADARLVARVMRRSFRKEYDTEGKVAAYQLLKNASADDDKVRFGLVPVPAEHLEDVEAGREVFSFSKNPPVLRLYLPVALPAEPGMALLLEESIRREHDYLAQTRLHIAAATLLLVLLLGSTTFVVGSRVVGEPIRVLIDKARRVGRGDLEGPVAIHQSDEIGELAETMNQMCEDLTRETSRRQEALEQLRHAERLATVGRLASGIAHELGTPLNVVLGRALMISEGSVTSGAATNNARIVVEQTERMIGIIRQLLDFARRGAAETNPADVRELTRHMAELLQPLANEARVHLKVDPQSEEAVALVDLGQVEQALTNLVVNAIQASPKGGEVRMHVDVVRTRPPGSDGTEAPYVRVSVEDDGEGIPEEVRPRLFEPFFTTKDVGQGTGLGLPVAHGIVSDHGGWIDVESAAGKGSRFSAYLPAQGVAA